MYFSRKKSLRNSAGWLITLLIIIQLVPLDRKNPPETAPLAINNPALHQLKLKKRTDLLNKFWLIYSNGTDVIYLFDEEQFIAAKNSFKNVEYYGLVGVSPIMLLITIMTNSFSFDKSLAKEAFQNKRPLSISWTNSKYIDESPLIHSTEVRLYNSNEYTGYVPCHIGGNFLIVGCPEEYSIDIMSSVKDQEEEICKIFRKSLKGLNLYFNLIQQNRIIFKADG